MQQVALHLRVLLFEARARAGLISVCRTSRFLGRAYHHLGRAYVQAGRLDEAVVTLERAVTLETLGGGYVAKAALGHAYGVAGRRDDAIAILEQMQEASQTRYVQPYLLATVQAGLDDEEETLALLEDAFDARDWWLPLLNVEPGFDELRPNPRFQDFLRRMSFPE